MTTQTKVAPKPRYSPEERFTRARDRFWKAALAYGEILADQRPDVIQDLRSDLHDLADEEHLLAA